MIGSSFGPYRVDAKLGQGGMGVVYKGYDTQLQRLVAIKVIEAGHKDSLGTDSEARFRREARAASRLQHPAIVAVYHFGSEGDTQYIVMEYVEGRSLRSILDEKALELPEFYKLGIALAEGLAAAHEGNVIHRDIKAENVMVTAKGQVKILDFGLAKLKDPCAATGNDGKSIFVTQPGVALGTVTHMSPEQAMGREVDSKTDVFSLGVVLYQMLTRQLPFEGGNATATLLRILEADPPSLRNVVPEAPQGLSDLVGRCLEKNPADRPSAQEVAEMLRRLRDNPRAEMAPMAVAATMAGVAAAPAFASGRTAAVSHAVMETAFQPVSEAPARAQSGGTAVAVAPAPVAAQAVTAPVVMPPKPPIARAPRVVAPKAHRHRTFAIVRGTRLGISVLFIVLTVFFVLSFTGRGERAVHDALVSGKIWAVIAATCDPVLGYLHGLVGFKTNAGKWDFLSLFLAFAMFFVRGLLLTPLVKWEDWLRARKEAGR